MNADTNKDKTIININMTDSILSPTTIKPDDIIVLSVDHDLHDLEYNRIKEEMKRVLDKHDIKNEIIILDGGITIGMLSAEEIRSEIAAKLLMEGVGK